jgi:hypothetical protein
VYVGGGTFTMQSGTISGNTSSSYGGGVYVVGSNGTFTKTAGTVTGYADDTVNGNVVKNGSGVVINNRGHAVYVYNSTSSLVKLRESTAGPGVNLSTNSNENWED